MKMKSKIGKTKSTIYKLNTNQVGYQMEYLVT